MTFDWAHTGNTSDSWVAWAVGTANGSAFIIDAANDHAILLRQNGQNQRFENRNDLGFSGAPFPTSVGVNSHKVTLTYLFGSFADGTNVNLIATVDGVQVASDTFQWDGNNGALHMEMATDQPGHFIDNLSISTLPPLSNTLAIVSAGIAGDEYHIIFKGAPLTTYAVRGSNDLLSFPLEFGNVTTNALGAGEAVIPLGQGIPREFYRIETLSVP